MPTDIRRVCVLTKRHVGSGNEICADTALKNEFFCLCCVRLLRDGNRSRWSFWRSKWQFSATFSQQNCPSYTYEVDRQVSKIIYINIIIYNYKIYIFFGAFNRHNFRGWIILPSFSFHQSQVFSLYLIKGKRNRQSISRCWNNRNDIKGILRPNHHYIREENLVAKGQIGFCKKLREVRACGEFTLN